MRLHCWRGAAFRRASHCAETIDLRFLLLERGLQGVSPTGCWPHSSKPGPLRLSWADAPAPAKTDLLLELERRSGVGLWWISRAGPSPG